MSIEDDVVREARRRGEATGTSLNQLVRDYLRDVAGMHDNDNDAAEFERLSLMANGDSNGWKFDREEAHERK